MNGIINVYKEKGYTSHDVVAKLRGILKMKKIGHTGTLDPDAEGVLPVCLGKGTKLCDMLTDKNKTYRTVLVLGKKTYTQDISGEVIEEKEVPGDLQESQVREAVLSFVGDYDQIPPMYSALKVNGKKLYELARQGITVERKARRVKIFNIEIHDINLPRVEMTVECSKGTYIRTLCNDIGEKLNTGACMESLLRTRTGIFDIENAYRLHEIEAMAKAGNVSDIIKPVDSVFGDLKKCVVKSEFNVLIYNGNFFEKQHLADMTGSPLEFHNNERVRVYDGKDNFIGIYIYEQSKDRFKPEKMFLVNEVM